MGLTGGSVVAGLASYGTLVSLQQLLGTQGLIVQVLQLCISGFVGILVFAIIVSFLKIPEVNTFVVRMRQRFLKR